MTTLVPERASVDEAPRGEEELNAVLDTIEYGICFMGPDLRARIANRAFRDMWNFADDFFDGHPSLAEMISYNRHTGIYGVPDEQWEEYVGGRVEAVRAGAIPPFEWTRADGMVLQYQCIVLPNGGRMLTYFDITEMKRREERLSELRQGARHDPRRGAGSAHPARGSDRGDLRGIRRLR